MMETSDGYGPECSVCGDEIRTGGTIICAECVEENDRLQGVLRIFVNLDWDQIEADMGGTPAPPDQFYDWDAFMVFARAALESK